MTERTEACRADGCDGKRSATDVLCRSCWYRVPKALRDRIWMLYRTARGSIEHLRAIADAVRIAEEELTA